MHQALHIPEILLSIFGYIYTEYGRRYLAVLARTCRTFKEPALDVLWEELYNLSPLVRCLPEACICVVPPEMAKLGYSRWSSQHYMFSRPLTGVERITLRCYARRVRSIRISSHYITEETMRVVSSVTPFNDPLFPHLQSLYWNDINAFSPLHIAVPSLKVVRLNLNRMSLPVMELFDALGDRCPYTETLEVHCFYVLMELPIARIACRWPKLQRLTCSNVFLNMDTMSSLSSAPSLKSLEFRVEVALACDISHLDSKLVFSSLTNLDINSKLLDSITSLLRHVRLPAIETLSVVVGGCIWRRAIQPYWAAIREVCPSYLKIRNSLYEEEDEDINPPEDEELYVTLDVLRPCATFAKLCRLDIDLACDVRLTDADLLELVSPHMESFLINYERGWYNTGGGGGITLSGLIRLLQLRPLLNHVCLAIDAQTFTEIPEGLDVSFPPRRQLKIVFLDSYIPPEFVPDLLSVFTVLGMDSSVLKALRSDPLWKLVFGAL